MKTVTYQMFLLLLAITIICCSRNKKAETKPETTFESQMAVEESKERFYESLKWDTVGMSQSGIIITDARFVQEEYSNYKTVRIRYKNISGKKIKAIRFKWHGINAFNDPAECGGIDPGFGGGFTDDPISSGSTETKYWDVMSLDGDEITMAWPTEIAFEDGTKWKSSYRMSH